MNKRTIVITGGASGIGRALALLCAARGDVVAILDWNVAGAEAVARESAEAGAPDAYALPCDVSQEPDVERAFASVRKRSGIPWGVFANAGIDSGGPIHELPLERWKSLIDTNLGGVFLTVKHALRHMLEGDCAGGSIVCTSSVAALVALAAGGVGAYSASKGGIASLVRCLAVDYARHGIRVNALAPGAIETPLMWNNVAEQAIPEMRQQLGKEIPMGRLADPTEPAKAALWLLSDDSSYVTGSQLVCDGGVLAKSVVSV